MSQLATSVRPIQDSRIPGVVTATVSNIDDPDDLGRIKVKFPWMGENYQSDWTSIAMPFAGDKIGFFFMPSVGDVVLVAFDHGDVNRPFIIGSLWNKKATPPGTSQDAKDSIFRIKTKEGNEIIFNDENNQANRLVEIRTGSGHSIIIGSQKIEIKDKDAKNSVCIDAQAGSVQLESSNKISIKAPTIEIEATANMKIKSSMLNVESSGIAEIKASGPMTIHGAIVKIN